MVLRFVSVRMELGAYRFKVTQYLLITTTSHHSGQVDSSFLGVLKFRSEPTSLVLPWILSGSSGEDLNLIVYANFVDPFCTNKEPDII